MSAPRIRRAESGDRAFLVSLSEEAFQRYSPRNPEGVALRALRGLGGMFVAEEQHEPLGFVIVALVPLGRPFGPWADPRLAHLDAIAVRAAAHGRGIGRLLLGHAEAYARESGAVSMSLLTARSNATAQRLFRTAGYQPILPREDVYSGRQAGIEMLKSLTLA